MFLLSNHDTTDVIYPEPQKNHVLSECRISGSKYHEEADTEDAPPPRNYPFFFFFSEQPCGILFLHYRDHQIKFISNLWKYWTTAAVELAPQCLVITRASFRLHTFLKASWSLLKELNGPLPRSQAFSCMSSVCFTIRLEEREAQWLKKRELEWEKIMCRRVKDEVKSIKDEENTIESAKG